MSRLQYAVKESLLKHKSRNLVTFKKDFCYERYSYEKIHEYSLRFITFLKEKDIKPKDKIAICSYNSPQYFYVFLGCMFYDVTLIPIDFGSSDELINRFMDETRCRMLISSKKKVTNIKKIDIEDLNSILQNKKKGDIWKAVEDDLLEIIYTSGTTGEPKGVMISHRNIYANINSVLKSLNIKKSYRLLSMLPLSHVFEQVAGFLALLFCGASTVHLKSRRPSEIIKVMQHEKINVLATVPAFYNLFYNKIIENAKNSGKYKLVLRLLKATRYMPIALKRSAFKKIHNVFGGHLKIGICGAATLPEETEKFWENIGVKILKGYGMTETSPVLTLTRENDRKLNSVGKPIEGVEIILSPDKEILAKGENVTKGYYLNENATGKLFLDGWLRTGDLGEFDSSGHLFIKGRLKNMILKPNGLNVYPEDIEKILDKIPGIKESCVIGIDKGHDIITTAVLLLQHELSDEKIKGLIDDANNLLEEHQKIQDFYVWKKKDFPRTLTLKVIRRKLYEEIEKKTTHTESSDEILHIISELCHVNADSIKENNLLFSDLGFDSLKVIELSTFIEEKLRVEIEEFRINNETTVSGLRELVKKGADNSKKLTLDKKMFWPAFVPLRLLVIEAAYVAASPFFKKVEIRGRENLKNLKGQFIVIINHSSHLDFPVLAKHFPLRLKLKLAMGAAADYFFKNDTLKSKLVSKLFYYCFAAFPLSRQKENESNTSIRQSFDFIGEIFSRGWSIGLSPEGTRSKDGKLGKFKNGIGMIIKESHLPVIPVKLEGLNEILPPSAKFPRKRENVKVTFGAPVYFDEEKNAVEITSELEDIMRKM